MPEPLRPPAITSAFVLGSTSTVAVAICRALGQQGCRRFHLVARNPEANQPLADELRERYGANLSLETVDLLAAASLEQPVRPVLRESFDLYLVTAGSLGDAERARTDSDEALRITAANFTGLLPWITAIMTPERIEQPGRLWLFSSVAGDRGRPSNYHYGAAKAALTTLGEGLLLRCQNQPFAVRVLKAGFMATPMTIGKAPPILCAKPEAVACYLLCNPNRRGIEYLPWFWCLIMALVRALPPVLASKL